MSGAWTKEQDALVMDTTKTDDQIARLVSEVGPERTAKAVLMRRSRLGALRVKKPRPYPAREKPHDGWPPITGPQEVRDREFVRRLLIAAMENGLLARVAA